MRKIYFISHPEVEIDPEIPVPQWCLSTKGRARMKQALALPWMSEITSIYASTEKKAIDGAQILAQHLRLSYTTLAALGENDRSSTGYLDAQEFEQTADAFFASPELSSRGWERAIDAQIRIYRAVETIKRSDKSAGAIAIVSHGAVGTLLYCYLANKPISRDFDQPGSGGGNYLKLQLSTPVECSWWQALDPC